MDEWDYETEMVPAKELASGGLSKRIKIKAGVFVIRGIDNCHNRVTFFFNEGRTPCVTFKHDELVEVLVDF